MNNNTTVILTTKELKECQEWLRFNPGGYTDFITYKRQKEKRIIDFLPVVRKV